MTTASQVPFRRAASLTLGVLDQIKVIALDAAREDEAGRWGVDGWVRLIHNLLDLQMRTYATVVDIALAGPSWWQGDADTDLGPSLPVRLDNAPPYPCTISILKSFERVGRRDIVIPDHVPVFVPAVLAAGATSFQIKLTDEQYAGASYVGKVRLRRSDGAGRDSSTVSFTVGL
jgi:hypothetical protein